MGLNQWFHRVVRTIELKAWVQWEQFQVASFERWKRGEDDRPCERTGTNEYSYLLCATGFSTKGNTIGGISPSGYKHTLSRGKCGEETLPSFLDASFKRSRLLTDRIETIHADGVTGKYLIYNGEWIILRLSDKSARYFTCLAYVPL